jgi:hypothetical protein
MDFRAALSAQYGEVLFDIVAERAALSNMTNPECTQ